MPQHNTASSKLRITADTLRNSIADCLHQVKAQDLPTACSRLGLRDGECDESFRGKRGYVKHRIELLEIDALIQLGKKVLADYEHAELSDLISEITLHSEHRISEITRRDILRALNPLTSLFGDLPVFDGLNIISPELLTYDSLENHLNFLPSLARDINQHYLRNDDLSHEEALIRCGALTCSQNRFIALIEKLVDPVVRRDEEQRNLSNTLNKILNADGFAIEVIGEYSGHSVYAVKRFTRGATGSPKNLIFASINTKPDLYFTDAINNDIAIKNDTDALIYDRFLSDKGLLWKTLVEWWQSRTQVQDAVAAQRSLYTRLAQAVKATSSPGEFAIFDTYYREISPLLGANLPALLPQVYLHYDPRTLKQRGNDPVLLRQRMDFLLLLDRNFRVVIEVDGKQHYAEGETAAPAKYASMVSEDRRLRLAGYELYRFGGGGI